MREHEPHTIRNSVLLGVSSLALASCGFMDFDSQGYTGSVNQATVLKGIVQNGADVYLTPTVRIEHNDGTSNRCARFSKNFKLDAKQIVEPVINDDPNGRFTGLMLSQLPESVRKKCAPRSTGTVWVKSIFVDARINKDFVLQIPPLDKKG